MIWINAALIYLALSMELCIWLGRVFSIQEAGDE